MNKTWVEMDDYFGETLLGHDAILKSVLAANADAGLPSYEVSPTQGKLLHLLARLQGARRILEIGTLGGYSSIWLARALPADGLLLTMEIDSRHAEVANANFEAATLSDRIELQVGDAVSLLDSLVEQGVEPFDFVFIDADKSQNAEYLEGVLKLSRPGTAILVDNVVRDGAIVDSENNDPRVVGVRRLMELMQDHPHIDATAIQTVGSKGYDGFVMALVR